MNNRPFNRRIDIELDELISYCKEFIFLLEDFTLLNSKPGVLKLGAKPIHKLNRLFKKIKDRTLHFPDELSKRLGRLEYVKHILKLAEEEKVFRNGVLREKSDRQIGFNTFRKRLRAKTRQRKRDQKNAS
jgi:hypothetical protein